MDNSREDKMARYYRDVAGGYEQVRSEIREARRKREADAAMDGLKPIPRPLDPAPPAMPRETREEGPGGDRTARRHTGTGYPPRAPNVDPPPPPPLPADDCEACQ